MGKAGEKFFSAILCSAIVMAAGAVARAQAGPVGHWKGDDGNPAPGAAVDSSGNGHNGTYTSGATTSTTVAPTTFANPTSMQFNGTSALVDVPTFSWPDGGPISVAFWNRVTTAQVQESSAFTIGGADGPSRCHTHAPWSDKKIYWDYGDLSGNGRIFADYTSYLDKWTHVALVSAGNGGNFKAIYLDGVEVASAAASDGPDVALSGVQIGAWTNVTKYHPGLIDDFRIYDYVLSPAEIAALATRATPPTIPAGLTATAAVGQIQLDWNADPNALSYNLGWSLTSGGGYTYVNVATNAYTHTGLPNGTTYYYVVNAVNTAGQSADSPQVSATTPTPPPRTQKLGERHMCGWSCVGSGDAWGLAATAIAAAVLAFYRTRPSANLR